MPDAEFYDRHPIFPKPTIHQVRDIATEVTGAFIRANRTSRSYKPINLAKLQETVESTKETVTPKSETSMGVVTTLPKERCLPTPTITPLRVQIPMPKGEPRRVYQRIA